MEDKQPVVLREEVEEGVEVMVVQEVPELVELEEIVALTVGVEEEVEVEVAEEVEIWESRLLNKMKKSIQRRSIPYPRDIIKLCLDTKKH